VRHHQHSVASVANSARPRPPSGAGARSPPCSSSSAFRNANAAGAERMTFSSPAKVIKSRCRFTAPRSPARAWPCRHDEQHRHQAPATSDGEAHADPARSVDRIVEVHHFGSDQRTTSAESHQLGADHGDGVAARRGRPGVIMSTLYAMHTEPRAQGEIATKAIVYAVRGGIWPLEPYDLGEPRPPWGSATGFFQETRFFSLKNGNYAK
jgi:hypothetical protein